MSRFFTSDWHLNSTLINQYAHRPWITDITNVDNLIRNCDEVASSKSDIVFHVGDFILIGRDKHGRDVDVQYLHNDADSYRGMLNANIVLLSGNHDDGHNCEADLKSMVIDLNHNYRDVSVSHYPSYHKLFTLPDDNCWKWFDAQKMYVHVHLCGHVHDKWLLNFDAQHKVLNVNVGVDVWNYKPVRDSEITEILDFIFDTSGPNQTYFDRTWTWTRKDLEHFQACQKHDRKQLREIRKKERYVKKGLTPEECERRRIEAMKNKGLF